MLSAASAMARPRLRIMVRVVTSVLFAALLLGFIGDARKFGSRQPLLAADAAITSNSETTANKNAYNSIVQRRKQRARGTTTGRRRRKPLPRLPSSFVNQFEAALQDVFMSMQADDEASSRSKADRLVQILDQHTELIVPSGNKRSSIPRQWSVSLQLGGTKPTAIVLSVSCFLLDAYSHFPKVHAFREVLQRLLVAGLLDPNTITPWMETRLPLLARTLIDHRYDIDLFDTLLQAGARFDAVHQFEESTIGGHTFTARRAGLSLLHLLLHPQETMDTTLKFLFEANTRLSPSSRVEATTDRLRFPGDIKHEFAGLRRASSTFRAIQSVSSEMSLTTSSRISEDVALYHYDRWMSSFSMTSSSASSSSSSLETLGAAGTTLGASASSTATPTATHQPTTNQLLCHVSLQLPRNGWNALHVCSFKGWDRMLRRLRDNVTQVVLSNNTGSSSSSSGTPRKLSSCYGNASSLAVEVAVALSQVGRSGGQPNCHWWSLIRSPTYVSAE